jgi:L-ascorbate metabolism protein UlaG (beta-lactamase superfamily)
VGGGVASVSRAEMQSIMNSTTKNGPSHEGSCPGGPPWRLEQAQRLRRLVALGASAALAGCFGAPSYEGPRTAHFDGHEFHNDPKVPQPGVGDVFRWLFSGGAIPWNDAAPVVPTKPPAHVEPGIRVTFVNHATVLVQMDGISILTDPVWAESVGPVSFLGQSRRAAPGVRFADLPRIDAVLVSHSHYDHCDIATLRALEKQFSMPVFAGLGSAAMLAEHDVPSGRDLDWWQSATVGDRGVTVTMTPARHGSQRGIGDRNVVLWGGFMVKGPSGSVFFAGDTAFGPHFAEIGRRLGAPTVALLPIGAYQPRWFMQNIHMNPAEAVRAHQVLSAEHSLGIHWGTFDLSDEGRFQPAGELMMALRRASVPEADFVAAKNGESFVFDNAGAVAAASAVPSPP